MSIEYSFHAKQQMKSRSISEEEVESCLNIWDIQCTDKKGNSIYKARIGGRGIKVVVAKDNPEFIITAADY
jgi:hypothetical protein